MHLALQPKLQYVQFQHCASMTPCRYCAVQALGHSTAYTESCMAQNTNALIRKTSTAPKTACRYASSYVIIICIGSVLLLLWHHIHVSIVHCRHWSTAQHTLNHAYLSTHRSDEQAKYCAENSLQICIQRNSNHLHRLSDAAAVEPCRYCAFQIH